MATRRTFLKAGAALGASALFPRFIRAFSQSAAGLRKFIAPLRGLGGPGGIPVATPTKTGPSFDNYELDIIQSQFQFHPELPASTVWGYNPVGNVTPGYLGGVIVASKNHALRVRYNNKLPNDHPLPIDDTIPGAKDFGHNRVCPHLHGGAVDWTADGGPFAWFDPIGNFGPSVANMVKRGPGSIELYYPNQASARLLWYHDHSIGITRQNAYAGIASAYLLRDDFELGLISKGIIPSNEIPLIIQDKTFFQGFDVEESYPVASAKAGDLWFPYQYEATSTPDSSGTCQVNPKGRWSYGPCDSPPALGVLPLPPVSSVAEFFSDTPVINGVAYPYLPVEPRHYRFRILNGSQARFYNLQLYVASNRNPAEVNLTSRTAGDGTTIVVPKAAPGPRIIQIGTEGGFLPFPVVLNDPPLPIDYATNPQTAVTGASSYNLLLAPGERVDVIIDFSKFAGKTLLLYNDAPAPFPGGDSLNDYCTGAEDQTASGGVATPVPGKGPNTRTLMQIRVASQISGTPDPKSLNGLEKEALALREAGLSAETTSALLPPMPSLPHAMHVRNLTLNESYDEYGRLIQMLGTDRVAGQNNQGFDDFGRIYEATPTEIVKAGQTEIWRIYNLTGDTHPMHFHLVDVRVLSRRSFIPTIANGKLVPIFTEPRRAADPNERGYKETVRMNPGEMTEILMTFDLPNVPYNIPLSPRLKKAYNIEGHEYVWHCHILDHEEHDMMRPLVVQP